MKDNQFATTLMTIVGVLIGLTVIILVISNILTSTDYSKDSLVQGNIEDRIQPVGTLAIAGVTPVNASAGSDGSADTNVASNDAGVSKSAEDLYTACAACHNAGVLNAPKLGDKAGWSARVAKGVDALYNNAINGIGTMPAKGGRADYSDDDIKKVVDYMLESVN
ncbi:MAG: c-type cytochrome [Gammaproteobacteria bacterium]|nr:c-type cytochrome [Gammaproteobacteria bacterium]